MSAEPVVVRRPMMSGHCLTPETKHPEASHKRCRGGNNANPAGEFQPCPCSCHLGETYECECGGTIREAPLWPSDDGEMTYVHIDQSRGGRAIGPDCYA